MDPSAIAEYCAKRLLIAIVVVAIVAVGIGVTIGYGVARHRPALVGRPVSAYGVGEAPGVLPPGSAPQPGKMVRDPLPPYVKPLGTSEKPSKPFVLVRVTDLAVSFAKGPIDGPNGKPHRLLKIHAEGIVPKSGYLAEMLLPRRSKLSDDGYDEYLFQAIPNVEEGVVGPTRIVADGEFSFDPATVKLKGVRVFGADGTRAEKPLPPDIDLKYDGREIIGTFPPAR